MTEDEAKTKWCPMVRCDGNNRHWGQNHEAAPISRCVGSACMAWRWTNGLSSIGKGGCGLAGAPQ